MRASNTFQISDMSEEARGKTYDLRILHKLVSYVAPYKLLIIVAALISLIHTGVQLLFPYITKIAIDDYILVSKLEGLSKIVAIYFLALIVGAFLSFGMSYLMQTIGQYIIRDIRVQTFSHLQHLRVAFFDRNPVGKLVTRVTNDGEALNQLFTEVVFSIFTDIAMLIGVIIVMFRLDAKLSMIAFTVVPPLVIITNLFRIKARKAYREIRKWLAQLNVHLNETFIGIKVIKLFNQPQANYVKFSAENHKYYQATMQQVVIYGIFTPIISLLFSCGTALIIWYGGGEVLQHTLSLGTLVAFLSYIAMFFRPIEDISTRFDVMQSSLTACERIFALIDTKEIETEDRGQKTEDRRQITDDKGEIEFKNVWFYYGEPSASPPRQSGISASLQQWVLRDISFKVRAGEKIAIVGSTGAGKTSLINLLARFYEPQQGEILIDGINIAELPHQLLRSKMAIVAQDDFIFSGSIADNIRLRNYQISDPQIHSAAKYANAHQFISRLPHQYEENIKERGTNLSSGELQLLSFARAIAFKPQILILDEATREVDPETEALIQEAISKLLHNRTALVIAHRLATIKIVDRIIVLHKGKIVEQGTHNELFEKNGLYATLYKLQYKNKNRH